ncbi:MAG: hypothetical protein RLZZ618_2885 [Pseudomonadota bacterium]|jgi:hypothetical protein
MSTRYGRRAADGTLEYHDNEASMREAQWLEQSAWRAKRCARIGFVLGGLLVFIALHRYGGADWPKALRFGLVLAGAGGLSFAMFKLANFVWSMAFALIALLVVQWVGRLVWSLV